VHKVQADKQMMWRFVKDNLRLSWKPNVIAAFSAALVTTWLSAFTIVVKLPLRFCLLLGVLHFVLSYLFLDFLWTPLTWFRKRFLRPLPDMALTICLSIILTTTFCLVFPYDLTSVVFKKIILNQWRMAGVVIGFHLLCAFVFIRSLRHLRLSSFRYAQNGRNKPAGEAPFRPRLLVGAFGFIIGLYFVVTFEWWMVNLQKTSAPHKSVTHPILVDKISVLLRADSTNFLKLPKFFQPYKALLQIEESQKPEDHAFQEWVGRLLPAISITLGGAFLLFLIGIVPLRLMSFVLPSAQHGEAAYCQRLINTPAYAGQFYRAILAENPLFSITSLVVLIFLIAMPLLAVLGGQPALLTGMVGADQILFIFALLAAWLSPIVYAGVYVDRTYGVYFNNKLSDLILGVRDHVVILGFGDLGQRVVNRELRKLNRRTHGQSLHRRFMIRRKRTSSGLIPDQRRKNKRIRKAWFEKVVSPELNIEMLCPHFIIVDRNSDNFFFATTNDSLGTYGVVAPLHQSRFSRERDASEPRLRILVPIVQGDATEPFTLSRVNLERASLLISTVSQEERIREIFTRAAEAGLRSIICVSRSDQMINLTYKATRHPITLVYPKQNSGLALGHRLIAATLKVRPQLHAGQPAPRIMVVGLNKSNHFMLETLWHNWPVTDASQKAEIFADMLRFVITADDSRYTMPQPEHPTSTAAVATESDFNSSPVEKNLVTPLSTSSYFNRVWRSNYITGFRHYQPAGSARPLYFAVPTCVMQSDEAGVLERCLEEFRPDILVINDDNVDKSIMLLVRAINGLERLKYEHPNLRLPLILMSAALGDEAEQKDIGDSFRLYEALTQLYRDSRAPVHPRHAYFRPQSPRRLVGDSVHDGLADAEEIISGIRDNWELADEIGSGERFQLRSPDAAAATRGEVFELNTCLPNAPGALARLAARLAGLEFSRTGDEPVEKFFVHSPVPGVGAPAKIARPSFQYLRHSKLEVPGRGFCLSGYADLQEEALEEIARESFGELDAIAARVYATDGRNYLDPQQADPQNEALPAPRLITLATGKASQSLHTQTFVDVMMGGQDGNATGEAFCPGMTICPIASYQHYIVATNGREIEAWQRHKENRPLRDAPNYGCARIVVPRTNPNAFPRYARIFCCCHAKRNDPGLIAVALNILSFQRFAKLYRRPARERNLANDWIVNVEYFKDVSCQNRLFSLNRLFGVRRYTRDLLRENGWTMDDYENRLRTILPISLLQIMPAGSPEDARRWFDYAVALYRYLVLIAPPQREFCFQWWDQNERHQEKQSLDPAAEEYPIAIQINNRKQRREENCCEFCGVEDPDMAFGCAQIRPWMEEDR
jgi:hypothetical protein